MRTLKPYIAGSFQEGKEHRVLNPYDGEVVAITSLCDRNMLEEAMVRGVEAIKPCRSYPAWKRYETLRFISDQIRADRDRLALVLSRESAKPLRYALAEIDRASQTFLIAAEESKRIEGEVLRMDWTPGGADREGIVKYFPVGLIAGISPFNFPLNLAVHKIAPAIASGCPIILKPASLTPLSTLELARIISQTDLPAGAVSIVPAGREAGNVLVTDDRINLLSFTGSDTVGWKMKSDAGKKKTVMELGGNAGVIITQSANISEIKHKCLLGAFAYSGQICIHAQRFFVHRTHFNEFLSEMKMLTSGLVKGAPDSPDTDISSMIDEGNAIRVEEWVNEALSSGAELVCGGGRSGSWYEPTILTNTKPEMSVNSEELFGPVITVEPFDDFETAIAMLNQSRFGLQAGVFTYDVREADMAFELIDAGGIILNDVPLMRYDHMPYGGIKDSGQGREGVKYAMKDMLEPKILVKRC